MNICLHSCLCTACTLGNHRDLKKVLDLLKLELQLRASTWVLGIKCGPLEEQPVLLTDTPSLQLHRQTYLGSRDRRWVSFLLKRNFHTIYFHHVFPSSNSSHILLTSVSTNFIFSFNNKSTQACVRAHTLIPHKHTKPHKNENQTIKQKISRTKKKKKEKSSQNIIKFVLYWLTTECEVYPKGWLIYSSEIPLTKN